MVQAVADDFGNDGLRRDPRELLFEPGFERQSEWFALFLAHGAALIGAFATDHLLDRIERGDAVQSFARDRRRTALCDIEPRQ